MKIVLPLVKPKIRYVQYHAYPLSIAGNHSFFDEWFFNHYINLYTCTLPNKLRLDFLNPPFLEQFRPLIVKQIPREIIAIYNSSVVDFIKNCIAQNYYIYVHLNESCITNSKSFGTNVVCHDILINGFDDEKSTFNVSGYDKDKNFSNYLATYNEISEGYERVSFDEEKLSQNLEDIYLIKLNILNNPDNDKFINLKVIKNHLKEYVNGSNCGQSEKMKFGIDVYKDIISYLFDDKVSIKNFHALLEHKMIMRMRVEYLMEKNYISTSEHLINNFKLLENHALLIKGVFMKAQYTGKKRMETLESVLTKMIELEKESINQLLEIIPEGDSVLITGNFPSRTSGSIAQYL